MDEKFLIRDVFNPQVITGLANAIAGVWPEFDHAGFLEAILPSLPEQTYSERNRSIRDALVRFLPEDFPRAAEILVKALPPPLAGEDMDATAGFILVPQCGFISLRGLDHYEVSMLALYEMTQRFSAEFDIRHFIEAYPAQTLERLAQWAADSNPHVRRLVSEGSRPRLPWGKRLQIFVQDPQPLIALLERMKNEPTLLVRRSIANNLNDIAKDHPDLVVQTLARWKKTSPGPATDWLARHATRTLVKQGHAGALELLGYSKGAEVEIPDFGLSSDSVKLGETIEIRLEVKSTAPRSQSLVIDYVVHFQKSNGQLAPKVFKWVNKDLGSSEKAIFRKNHAFRNLTTRVHYPGLHRIAVQVNGVEMASRDFMLSLDFTEG